MKGKNTRGRPPKKAKDKRLGNEFWKARSKHGKDKIFSTPEILLESAYEYFQWCIDNPLIETVLQSGKKYELPKMRAMTETGLCVFLNCDLHTFMNYGREKQYKDYFSVVRKIKEIIRTQKFEGASAGFLNANIIARDLGLTDKHEVEHSVNDELKDKLDQLIEDLG